MVERKKRHSQPPHVPDEKTRAQVAALVVAGCTQDMIARVIGISDETLRKYYHSELETAMAKTIGNIANTLVQKALSGDTASIIFFLKAKAKKMGWSERLEIAGEDGGPVQMVHRIERVIVGAPNAAD